MRAGLCFVTAILALPAAAHSESVALDRFIAAFNLNPAESDRFRAAAREMLATPTGAEIAREFASLGMRASAAFDSPAGSSVDLERGEVRVSLAASSDPSWSKVQLAHELSHAIFRTRAEQAGVRYLHRFYEPEEQDATVAGWLVRAEGGDRFVMDATHRFLADSAGLSESQRFLSDSYAGQLTREQARNARAVWDDRLIRARGLGNAEIVRHLESLLRWIDQPGVQAELAREADHPYLRAFEGALARRVERLRGLVSSGASRQPR